MLLIYIFDEMYLGNLKTFFFSFLKPHAIGKNYDVSPIAITSQMAFIMLQKFYQ